jgi:large subunit ribosomal protein L3
MSEQQTETQEATSQEGQASSSSAVSGGRATATLSQGRGGILGVKAGMTQVYDDHGNAYAVTVISVQPNVITQVKAKDKNGYNGIQIGMLSKKSANKAEKNHLSGIDEDGFYYYQEFRLPEGEIGADFKKNNTLTLEFLKEGDLVDLTSVSKGKGFQGVMKRHHFAGGPASHGASLFHRHGGSIGNRADPGKVFKNRKMAGHMGHKKVTVQNVKVFKVDLENNLVLVHGSIPGPKQGIVTVRKAMKA